MTVMQQLCGCFAARGVVGIACVWVRRLCLELVLVFGMVFCKTADGSRSRDSDGFRYLAALVRGCFDDFFVPRWRLRDGRASNQFHPLISFAIPQFT